MNAPVRVLPPNLNMPGPRMPTARGTGNGSVAPVCPISKSQAIVGSPGPLLPMPPRAVDLPSAINAINQLSQIILQLTNPSTTINNSLRIQQPSVTGNWSETGRVTQIQRVFNPNDSSQWVDVERINQLTMTQDATGDVLKWNYQQGKQGPGGQGTGGLPGQ
jgi:hypothetical protein